ncbi:hypothetical protein AQF52_3718 [Streptomyces venezuelae]|uniref:hypothetical protein n=1 Tax=Streptomyces gardneri TaxID=66892 RepID=UPI0006BCB285|nr:hypothetical protein [Streptomyces gardneri]ALO09312.1 hypothetical protein AQF52_3718 [Streptomyces venezuelae]QPK46428.1 hypothetical protein H4W23_18530 [Streptomyces gardneri]WRK37812.1 hypothetical protein U0M97_18625 [Streptomyces venezuelae]CUM40281.1 (S)-2-hydroxy-acid oxidase [Streptomyces venezuelae]
MSGLAVRAAAAVRSPEGRAPEDRPAALDYFRDLLTPFGEKPDEELLNRGAHVQHRDLVDLLVADEGVGRSRPELLVVTHALPDVVPFTAVAPHMTDRLGGRAANFAIAQQGLAAPFTALRIASAYHRAGRASEVVIAVLEQTTLPTPFPLVQDTPLIDSAAALVLGAGGEAGAGTDAEDGLRFVRAHSAASAAEALGADALGRDIGEDGTLLVLGPWVTGDVPESPAVHRVAPGSYCTSLWLELADHWQEWRENHRRIVLCDTDPRSGRSHVALFARGEG